MAVVQKQNADDRVSATPGPSCRVDVSIIIVNWNSADFVRQCVKSIRASGLVLSHEVLVVDSGSFDQCGKMLALEFAEVRFIQSRANVGFASANNLGARLARGRFLLFLNPDTEVVGPAIEKLVQALEREPETGLAGARLLNADGTLQSSCIQSFPTILNQFLDSEWLRRLHPQSRLWGMAPLHEEVLAPSVVEVVSGACLMIRGSLFRQLSGFDERFFMYAEDLDLCYRARQAGNACLFVPEAVVIHHGGGSSSSARSMFSVVMMRESVHRLLTLHRGRGVAFGYRAVLGIAALVRLPLIMGAMALRATAAGHVNQSSFRKWIAILRWSLGLERWAGQKPGVGKVSLPVDGASANGGAGDQPESQNKESCAA